MGRLIANYSERDNRFYRLGAKIPLKLDEVRRVRASPLRYCLLDHWLYIPKEDSDAMSGHLCWARIDSVCLEYASFSFGGTVIGKGELVSGLAEIEDAGVEIGNRYQRRWREANGRFIPVPEFCSQTLIDALAEHPEALPSVNSDDFERLCAEMFARRGFKVDLFRRTADGGIDFVALQDERTDPTIFAVQVKQPKERLGKPRRSVGRPIVQQIYGAAKAWNLKGGIVISGSTYSASAKEFAGLKTAEMEVHDGRAVLDWITRYRWNEDEFG